VPPRTGRAKIEQAPWLALVALVALVLAQPVAPGSATEVGTALLGIDPSFAPSDLRQPSGTVLQRVRHPTTDQIRWADTRTSIEKAVDLGAGRRLVRLDRFGRKVDHELGAALRSADDLVLDLRHNHGGVLRRMLRVASRFTGPVPGAVRLIKGDDVRTLSVPAPSAPVWRGRITVLVGANTISSGEVLAALLRRHAGAAVLGERTWGKDYVLRVERVDPDWRALIPDGRIEVAGEVLAGGLVPDAPIPERLAADLPND
jgi:C-terminal processing protease CtpA/Prc